MYAFTYRAYRVSWWLTILLKEIKRQLVKAPLAAAISPYLISLAHPIQGFLNLKLRLQVIPAEFVKQGICISIIAR